MIGGDDRARFLLVHEELRHAQQLFRALHLRAVEHARLHDLAVQPAGQRVGDLSVLVPEVEALDHLRSLLGQLDADGVRLLEALDLVAAEAAVAADRLLAQEDRPLLVAHLRDLLVGGLHRHAGGQQVLLDGRVAHGRVHRRTRLLAEAVVLEAHQVRGDVRRLLVGEPQVRHARVRPVALRVLDPGVQPARVDLGAGAVEVRAVRAVGRRPERVHAALVVADAVAAEAPDRLERLAPGREVARGRRRVRGRGRVRLQVGDDRVDLDVVPLLLLGGLVDAHVPHLRHARGPEALRLLDPAEHPLGIGLGRDVREVGADLAQALPALDLVAAVAAVALDQEAAGVEVRGLRHLDDALVALRALGLGLALGHHGQVPVVHGLVVLVADVLAPGLLLLDGRHGVRRVLEAGGAPAALVADRAADAVDRVRALQHGLEVRVGRVRLGRLLVALLVDRQVAGRAAVDLGRRQEDHVVVQVRRHDLVDLERRVQHVEHRQVAHVEHEAGRPDLGEALLQARPLGVELLLRLLRLDLRLLQVGDARGRGGAARVHVLELRAQLAPAPLQVVERLLLAVGAAAARRARRPRTRTARRRSWPW